MKPFLTIARAAAFTGVALIIPQVGPAQDAATTERAEAWVDVSTARNGSNIVLLNTGTIRSSGERRIAELVQVAPDATSTPYMIEVDCRKGRYRGLPPHQSYWFRDNAESTRRICSSSFAGLRRVAHPSQPAHIKTVGAAPSSESLAQASPAPAGEDFSSRTTAGAASDGAKGATPTGERVTEAPAQPRVPIDQAVTRAADVTHAQEEKQSASGDAEGTRKQWGLLAYMAGRFFINEHLAPDLFGPTTLSISLTNYEWEEPGKLLMSRGYDNGKPYTGKSRYVLDAGKVYSEGISSDGKVVRNEITFENENNYTIHGPSARGVYTLRDDGSIFMQWFFLNNGHWSASPGAYLYPTSKEAYFEEVAKVPQRLAEIQQRREQLAAQWMAPDPAEEAAIQAEWDEWEANLPWKRNGSTPMQGMLDGLQNFARHNAELDRIRQQGQARVAEIIAERQQQQTGPGSGNYVASRPPVPASVAPAASAPLQRPPAAAPAQQETRYGYCSVGKSIGHQIEARWVTNIGSKTLPTHEWLPYAQSQTDEARFYDVVRSQHGYDGGGGGAPCYINNNRGYVEAARQRAIDSVSAGGNKLIIVNWNPLD